MAELALKGEERAESQTVRAALALRDLVLSGQVRPGERLSELSLVERLGIYDHLDPMPAMSLGAGVTTLLKITTGYSMLANGGKKIVPSLIDRVQDRYGHTIFRHDKRECAGCNARSWTDQPEPEFLDQRDEVINPYTAYQITSMLEGVVQRGTGQALKAAC